ncbi:hypothetical protein, partial [Burkholderia gladioli]|uniref:hypothetical protein n=1 Tax=Burkholderia gladioli TaxID=28095 RepID=UPI002FE37E28
HAKFPVDPAARKFYLEHPLILGGTTLAASRPHSLILDLTPLSIPHREDTCHIDKYDVGI